MLGLGLLAQHEEGGGGTRQYNSGLVSTAKYPQTKNRRNHKTGNPP